MGPEQIAELILSAHCDKREVIQDVENFKLYPQLEYSGRVAKTAYFRWRKKKNTGRRKVGCFDFKAYRISGSDEIPLKHPELVDSVGTILDLDSIEKVFVGGDPTEFSMSAAQSNLLQEVQFAMIEQEINWGDEEFQIWSHFSPRAGRRPRDYVMSYLRRVIAEPDFVKDMKKIVAASGQTDALSPPLDEDVWGPYWEDSGSRQRPWLDGALLERYRESAEESPDNPYYARAYRE